MIDTTNFQSFNKTAIQSTHVIVKYRDKRACVVLSDVIKWHRVYLIYRFRAKEISFVKREVFFRKYNLSPNISANRVKDPAEAHAL